MSKRQLRDAEVIAEQAAQIRELQHRLQLLQRDHEVHSTHYRHLEAVCWQLLADVHRLKVEQPTNTSSSTQKMAEALKTALSDATAAHTSSSLHTSGASAAPPCPRMNGPLHLTTHDAEALAERLWALQCWVRDLTEGLHAFRSPRSNIPVDCSTRSLANRETQKQSSSVALQRLVDDLFLQFTQLQAFLTDTLWTPAFPPALSTPARSGKDSAVEMERLRTINQQLRRTLREYERANHQRRGTAAPREEERQLQRASPVKAVTATPRPPAGYAASSEEGLFVALPRKQ